MFDYVLLRKYCKDISVLFVEDDENILKEMHLLLKDLFDFVDVAKNGEEAFLKYTNYYKENKKNYDLLITDILMPIVNGIELIKSVYSINKKQLVMVLSAHSEKEYLVIPEKPNKVPCLRALSQLFSYNIYYIIRPKVYISGRFR